MLKINSLISDFTRLRKKIEQNFPELVSLAKESETSELFKDALRFYVSSKLDPVSENSGRNKVIKRILLLINYDNTTVDELSTGEQMPVSTITYFWQFLSCRPMEPVSIDLFIDLYYQFKLLDNPVVAEPDRNLVRRQMNRWPTGLDEEVIAIRQANKDRIIKGLIKRIERRHAASSRYYFDEALTYEEKYALVSEWWNTSRFHLSMAIKSPTELNYFLDNSLSGETLKMLMRAKKKGMPFFVTPYYLSLLNPGKEGYDDATIRSYILYSDELVDTYGEIKAWEKEDVVVGGEPNAAGWLVPEGHNIHRRYPEVAILIPDSMGRACGGLCASCQRMYDFQSERLNFDFEALKPKETWDKKLRRLMQYFEDDAQLRDILITGGDAFMSQNATLRKILEAVYKMALRKKKANEFRPDGEKYAELQRVRLGSRLLAYLPLRITDDLVEVLREFKEKASLIGISQFYVQTHFQSPLEVTPEAEKAIRKIQDAGWTITNQLVYNVAASRRGHTAKLRQMLNSVGVVCYYTFSVKGFRENYAIFTPNSRSLQEEKEEKVFGLIPKEIRGELDTIIKSKRPLGKYLSRFLKEHKLLFAGTDRSVLNLPGIGKSMTFVTVGITAEGKRILRFDHDASRKHSPIINKLGQVYIVENKSIAAYLRQLKEMGEDMNEYTSIWNYCEGKTERHFSLYEYPDYPFTATEKMTNLDIEDKDC
ncbi:lysine 2,3-aminomutase [Parabacteroides sp. PF5-5]|uniref:KamA family radical SAM protein n=1 Tax=unclassified Parabacteroides TaxID=2649774 RepID=UPI0024750BCC|nr:MULTISPECIES: KamA family protein [unclassified Parabacteroides]MDH6303847.1 lysine 2,3-aminomutase [Parabacteroides sp. PH5-39]MDH6314464.1 lysine 2,3-aminomutase [Parabacteroides sp. PF5-13]MDH6318471.1 lysine 2,3-aminomutase [Parabacteroides sp. PH5-13]MDH6322236.1 lysine 2,3-aminomutase [Parabacteroides sp. PH5-8]MDH6325684.1 lysine 2,3-aminomutase [Parabacteroides sp. PH5-41]